MRLRDGHVVFSPSDLNVFFESPFASWMDRLVVHDRAAATPDPRPAELKLVAGMGDAHELAYLDELRSSGRDVREMPSRSSGVDRVAETLAAMRAGHDVIYQATLRHGGFEGHADFLMRVDEPSPGLGAFHYEVVDTKLARKPKAYFLLQLCAYAEMLEGVQGRRPRHVRVVNGARETLSFRTDDYYFFYQTLKEGFLEVQGAFDRNARPTPEARADHGRWQSHADALLEETDHPSRVAGISMRQVERLAEAGILTMTELGRTTVGLVSGLAPPVFARLRAQARLQIDSVGLTSPLYEVVLTEAADRAADPATRGLALLPPASRLDVFFDMEGYPFAEGGLEYLFGAMHVERGQRAFVDFWAHDAAGERLAFEGFVDWAFARHLADPAMHIYHYASYEVTALRRLAGKYGTREEKVDVLLRAEVFVDLYRVVRQGIRVGEPRYSLKNVEHLYRGARQGDVASAAQSVVEYARWLDVRDGEDWKTSQILGAIRDYNRDDCESTLELAEWLRKRQNEVGVSWRARATSGAEATTPASHEDEIVATRMLDAMPEGIEDEIASGEEGDWRVHQLLAFLVGFHRREDKPFWWGVFDKQKNTHEDLVEDPDCLGDLRRTDVPPRTHKRSTLYEYAFDAKQDTKMEAGAKCFVAADLSGVYLEELDLDQGRAVLKVGPARPEPPERLSLIPNDNYSTARLAESVRRTATAWEQTRKLAGAVHTLLFREPPRIAGQKAGATLLHAGEDQLEGTVRVVRSMQQTTLAIQGPPGAGKTWAAAHAILALVREGKRVGVSSNSHKAIDKLMEEVLGLAKERRVKVRAAKIGGSAGQDADAVAVGAVERLESIEDVTLDGPAAEQLVGGTAWAFSHQAAIGGFDYLFVDEAGQVSLANLIAMAPSAKNLVLLGDQMQLSQPTKATHPGQSGMSALDYLLEGHATIPEVQGIFLATTWRMHPTICRFISGAFYEDRLGAEECTSRRVVRASHRGMLEAGIRFVPAAHEDNVQSSEEEGELIEALVAELCKRQLLEADGTSRRVTNDDILIVAPYNMQVRLLRKRLPGLRIASVDKFQGQEAPIVILSMCASEATSGRGVEFLFSPNRLNVALSRAESLAIVVGSPALARTRVKSLKQMRLVNLYCRILIEASATPRPRGKVA